MAHFKMITTDRSGKTATSYFYNAEAVIARCRSWLDNDPKLSWESTSTLSDAIRVAELDDERRKDWSERLEALRNVGKTSAYFNSDYGHNYVEISDLTNFSYDDVTVEPCSDGEYEAWLNS